MHGRRSREGPEKGEARRESARREKDQKARAPDGARKGRLRKQTQRVQPQSHAETAGSGGVEVHSQLALSLSNRLATRRKARMLERDGHDDLYHSEGGTGFTSRQEGRLAASCVREGVRMWL